MYTAKFPTLNFKLTYSDMVPSNIICMYMYIHTVYGTKQYMCDGQLESDIPIA